MTPNHSVKPTRSGLRPPRAAYLKRYAKTARFAEGQVSTKSRSYLCEEFGKW
jgi:hypothetical protein